MIDIIPFKPEHMVGIEKSESDPDVLVFLSGLNERAEQYAKSGPASTMMENGKVLAVGGVVKFWAGVGEAWLMVAPEGRQKGLILFRHMGKFLDFCFVEHRFHRIQASIPYGHKEAHRCIMKLGFIPEGMMVRYGPDMENYVRYVRL